MRIISVATSLALLSLFASAVHAQTEALLNDLRGQISECAVNTPSLPLNSEYSAETTARLNVSSQPYRALDAISQTQRAFAPTTLSRWAWGLVSRRIAHEKIRQVGIGTIPLVPSQR